MFFKNSLNKMNCRLDSEDFFDIKDIVIDSVNNKTQQKK